MSQEKNTQQSATDDEAQAGEANPHTQPEAGTPLSLLHGLVSTFGAPFDEGEDVNGGDVVEWLGEFLPLARQALDTWQRDLAAYERVFAAYHASAADAGRGGDGRASRAVQRLEASVRKRLGAPLIAGPGAAAPPCPATLVQEVVDTFGQAFDADEDVNGGDAVEWLGEFLPRARSTLRRY